MDLTSSISWVSGTWASDVVRSNTGSVTTSTLIRTDSRSRNITNRLFIWRDRVSGSHHTRSDHIYLGHIFFLRRTAHQLDEILNTSLSLFVIIGDPGYKAEHLQLPQLGVCEMVVSEEGFPRLADPAHYFASLVVPPLL